MNKTLGLGAVFGLLVALVVAMAPTAQAYPDVTFKAEVSDQLVFAGQTFRATSSANVECAWTHEWNGTTHRGVGKDFTSTFTAPEVKKRTVIPLHFACTYHLGAGAGMVAVKNETATRTIDVTVLPAREVPAAAPAAGGSAMPNTGGPNVLFLAAGLLLLLSGAVAVRVARGRFDGDA